MTDKKPNSQINPAVAELQALRRELVALRDEVSGLRKDVKEKKLVDQIAKGVVLAMLFWVIVWVVFGGLLSIIFGR